MESIEQPAKLLRIGSMVKQLLEEVRQAPLDEASRGRLREIYEQSIRELADGLSPDLAAELDRVSIPFDNPTPSEAELRIAHAQLVGWLEGLFHGIQATLVAQQVAARAQLDEMRQRSLDGGEATSPARAPTCSRAAGRRRAAGRCGASLRDPMVRSSPCGPGSRESPVTPPRTGPGRCRPRARPGRRPTSRSTR